MRVAGVSVDISERKRTEEALRLSEERFALAVLGSDDGVWDFDYMNNRVFGSRRAREILGMPLEPEVQSLDEWFNSLQLHPDDAKMRESAMQAHLNGLTPAYEGEWRVWHPNGHYRWVRVRGMCVRDATGKPLRMAGSVSDIDARKRAEESLRQSEERYALAVAGSDDGVWDWDLTTGMAFESARARELQGLAPGPELQRLDDLLTSLRVHPDDASRRADGIRAHLAGETPAYECEYRVRRDDGSYRWIRVRALCIRDANGKPYRMAGSVSDVHARKEAEDGAAQVAGALRARRVGFERRHRRLGHRQRPRVRVAARAAHHRRAVGPDLLHDGRVDQAAAHAPRRPGAPRGRDAAPRRWRHVDARERVPRAASERRVPLGARARQRGAPAPTARRSAGPAR